MPWESKTVEEIMKEFIEAAKSSKNLSALCREFEISRPTAYKWLEREQNWRIKYNEIRPHEALGMRCPAEVYQRSEREYIDEVKNYEYGGQFHVIKVNSWGYVRFDKWQEYLSETMIGEFVVALDT